MKITIECYRPAQKEGVLLGKLKTEDLSPDVVKEIAPAVYGLGYDDISKEDVRRIEYILQNNKASWCKKGDGYRKRVKRS